MIVQKQTKDGIKKMEIDNKNYHIYYYLGWRRTTEDKTEEKNIFKKPHRRENGE